MRKINKHLKQTLLYNNLKIINQPLYIDAYNRRIRYDGISGTITTRVFDGNDCYVVILRLSKNLKNDLCNYLIKNNMVKECDVIRHSYKNSRINNFYVNNSNDNNICPTLDTRCDCLGVVVKCKIK